MNKILLFLVVLMLLLSGCTAQPASESASSLSEESASEPSSSFPSSASASSNTQQEQPASKVSYESQRVRETLSSGVTVDAQAIWLVGTDFSGLSSMEGTLHRFSYEGVKEQLIGNSKVTHEEQQPSADSSFPDASYYFCETEDGKSLATIEENINFTTSGWNLDTMSYFTPYVTSQSYNGDAFQTGTGLDFTTASEAFESIQASLSQLGVSVAEVYQCYTLDSGTLLAEAKKAREDLANSITGLLDDQGNPLSHEEILETLAPIPNYSPEQDCYYFQFYAAAGEYPITQEATGVSESGTFVPGAIIEAAFSREGLVMLNVSSIYDIGEALSTNQCLDLKGALQALDEKYNSIILDGDYHVIQIGLEYVPIGKGDGIHVTLTPAWRFLVRQTQQMGGKEDSSEANTIITKQTVYLNAITGKEILTDLGGI